jgi:hypothetical protein
MSNRVVLKAAAIVIVSFFCLASISFAAAPAELQGLRKTYQDHKHKLIKSYIAQLLVLEQNMLSNSDLAGAKAVRLEKQQVEKELAPAAKKIQRPTPSPPAAVAPKPVPPKPVPPKPKPVPVVKRHIPKTYVSSVEGLAGAAKFSKNNIYKFNLPKTGTSSSLTFWASGRRSTESTGHVWLITPDGIRKKVGKWKDSYFDKPASDASSYKRLQPITEDISDLVTRPGVYKIEFEWTGGIDPLVILRVEITS